MTKFLVGPLLGLESENLYTVCFLTPDSVGHAHVTIDGETLPASEVGKTYSGKCWRVEKSMSVPENARTISYTIQLDGTDARDGHDRQQWAFHLPGKHDKPRFAYTSCNGFSSSKLVTTTDGPYRLWERMAAGHATEPFSMLLMGGDQLYADDIWSAVSSIRAWSEMSRKKQLDKQFTSTMSRQVDAFYQNLYVQRWKNEHMSLMMASVPTLMMWDDHDIFDGWGSYPKEMQECKVYQGIFSHARRYFELLQIRSKKNRSLLSANASHYAFGLRFRGYHILALDNRTERTETRVMGPVQWHDVIQHLDQTVQSGDLLLLSAIPVIYRDFSVVENAYDLTPWEEELTDDLKDHWRAKAHQGERARLVMRLLANVETRNQNGSCRTVILSGDVHIGCLGVINDRRHATTRKIHQVVSSGIVHPPPGRLGWAGIKALTNDNPEYLNEDRSIEASILKPYSSVEYLRARNFATLAEGNDEKLWINWICEAKDQPVYPLD